MMIDAHIHFDQYAESQREIILKEMSLFNISHLISVSTSLASCKENLTLAKKDKRILPAFGFHPEQVLIDEKDQIHLFEWIRENRDHMVAIGEVGLPYYRNKEKGLQYQPYIDLLEQFISLATEIDKPIVLHAVYEDAEIVCDLLEKYKVTSAHFHWFKGDKHVVKRMISNGYFISITPDVLYEKEIQQLVHQYPLEQMMIETDGPWPFEGNFFGEMTHPKMMRTSFEKIAAIKQLSFEAVSETLYENTKKFFRVE
ncbi:TatD family hydrolase [Viridibacillus sp. YIM B01967]|uniref:TatD family hydrolase n=2 Tax=Viridibacillus soli TaxID=2798301 RepID=A0ABS1H5T8_9BACL|nr:TatD family hydrolase [Viridibacillus soli]